MGRVSTEFLGVTEAAEKRDKTYENNTLLYSTHVSYSATYLKDKKLTNPLASCKFI